MRFSLRSINRRVLATAIRSKIGNLLPWQDPSCSISQNCTHDERCATLMQRGSICRYRQVSSIATSLDLAGKTNSVEATFVWGYYQSWISECWDTDAFSYYAEEVRSVIPRIAEGDLIATRCKDFVRFASQKRDTRIAVIAAPDLVPDSEFHHLPTALCAP